MRESQPDESTKLSPMPTISTSSNPVNSKPLRCRLTFTSSSARYQNLPVDPSIPVIPISQLLCNLNRPGRRSPSQNTRRAETEPEKEAFFWFFSKFLACVVVKQQWAVQKQSQLILHATMTGSNEKLVTKSNEAFTLLMYENDIDK